MNGYYLFESDGEPTFGEVPHPGSRFSVSAP
jgi:hypothetical protein